MKLLMNAQKIKLLVFALVIAAAVGCGIFIVSQNNTSKFQQQLKLGNEALLNLDYEGAVAAFANAIGIDSNSVEAYLGIAEAYIGLNDYGMASEYLSIGYEEIPSPSILSMLDSLTPEDYVSLGKELLTQGNPDLAKDAFEEALKKDPNNEEALKGLEDAKNHPDYSGDEDAGNDAPSDGGASNPSNATPPAANNSSLQFDPYGFTFMGYPIHEDHYEDWKSAVGYNGTETNDATWTPGSGNGYGERIECVVDGNKKSFSLAGELVGEASYPHTSWHLNDPEISHTYYFTIRPNVGGYSHIASQYFAGPIMPGDSFSDVLALCGYTGVINTNEQVSLGGDIYLFCFGGTEFFGSDKGLSIRGEEFSISLDFANDKVIAFNIYYN